MDCTGHFIEFGALLETCIDVERKHGKYGTIHGHGHGHLIQRNAIEEDLHVFDRADGHTGFADIAHYAGVIGVISAVRCKVKCHGKTFLSGCKVAAIEGVGFGGGGEAGVLTDGPRTQGVHCAVRAAQEWRYTRYIMEVFEAL